MKRSNQVISLFAVLSILLMGSAQANVWVNENFDDGVVFDHAAGGAAGGALDYWFYVGGSDPSPLTSASSTGTLTTERALSGANSFKMVAGEGLGIDAPFTSPGHGPFQYLQFAVSVADVPAAAGVTMAEMRWPFTFSTNSYEFFVRVESDGSGGVNLIGGQDLCTTDTLQSATIGTIPASELDEWRMITIQIQKNAGTETDGRLGDFATGVYFYAASATPGLTLVPAAVDLGDASGAWELTVSQGTVYVDDLYFEGAMTGGYEANGDLRTLTVPVELSTVSIE